MSSKDSIDEFAKFVKEELNGFDILIHNAAVSFCETGNEENLGEIARLTMS